MKYYSVPVVLFVMLVSLPNTLLARDCEQREKSIHEKMRQQEKRGLPPIISPPLFFKR